jgi:hypothetical protein
MMREFFIGVSIGLVGIAAVAGCRDASEPEPRFNRNLAEADGGLLLPSSYSTGNKELLTGTASVEPVAEIQPGVEASASGSTDGASAEGGLAEVQAFLTRYKAAFDEGDFDALIGMTVEEEREYVRAVVPELQRLIAAAENIRGVLEGMDPQPPMAAQLIPGLSVLTDFPIDPKAAVMIGESEGQIAIPMSSPFSVVKIGDEWLGRSNETLPVEQQIALFTAMADAVEEMADTLADSSLSDAERTQKLTATAMKIMGAMSGAGSSAQDD